MPRHSARPDWQSMLILLLASCASPLPSFRAPVYVGLEPFGDPRAQARLLADFAALSQVRAVDLSEPRNSWAFEALHADKLRLSISAESGSLCLSARYVVLIGGRVEYRSGFVIPRPETAVGRDDCLALLASRLSGDLLLGAL